MKCWRQFGFLGRIDPGLRSLLARFEAAGGVLDYIFLERQEVGTALNCHRAAAIAGMAEIDRGLELWANINSSAKYPMERFFRVNCDTAKVKGERVSFRTFLGTEDVKPKPIGERSWSIPNIDGYKTAFFHPPHGLRKANNENLALFKSINRHVLGEDPQQAEIFSWSTDWSNYFDAGHEWWGAYYWTILPPSSQWMTVVGASSTD